MTEYLRARVVRKDEGEDDAGEDGPLRIIAATGGRKADGLNLPMDRADLARFKANPVVMYGHMYGGRENLPIGRAESTWTEGDELQMDIDFDRGDEFAAEVERKYRAGYLNTFSVGFDAFDVDEQGVPARWELHEVSAVPIPMDPSAVVARDMSRDAEVVAAARSLVERADAEDPGGESAGDPDPEAGAASGEVGDEEPLRSAALAHKRRRLRLAEQTG